MVYPALFSLPGFMILAIIWMTYPHPVIQACVAIGFVPSWILQSWRLMGVTLAVGLTGGLLLGVPHGLVYIPLAFVGWALFAVGSAARCPRCRYTLIASRRPWDALPHNHWCPMCGRSRERVWPGQYLAHPETWDGEYHDEGGGNCGRDALVVWWRHVLYQRYLRREKTVRAGS